MKWVRNKFDRELHAEAAELGSSLGVSPLVAALLIQRGLGDEVAARRFLYPSIDHLHDPFKLKDVEKAAERIKRAITADEKIMVWGDFDVDGTTGTFLLRKVLHHLGAETTFHIPNRFSEGYGINTPGLEKAKNDGVGLVITVDCGIRSHEPLQWAAENSLDVIVTDHHLPDEILGNPPAVAVVNPNQPDCNYPDKDLAGVGVAFKLAQVLLGGDPESDVILAELLKITAIGTISDLMNLSGENRAIVSLGLNKIGSTTNFGLKALMEVADCRSDMTSVEVGFRIGPRINAAGRMDAATHIVELLEAKDFASARKIAAMLDSRNRERQETQQKITEYALFETAQKAENDFVVVAGDDWHKGVIGLAASRIADKMYRPVIVLTVIDDIATGSARSIPEFPLMDALDSCADLFINYGGHRAAAGMKLPADKIDELATRLNAFARAHFKQFPPEKTLNIDASLRADSIRLSLVDELKVLEPFGIGNEKPTFHTSDLLIIYEPTVMKDKHLKLWLADKANNKFEAVWWDGVARSQGQTLTKGKRIEIAYTVEDNTWQGNRRLQLVVKDIKTDN